MAVHRKRPLLRDPISGKRPRRRLLLLSVLIVVGGLGVLTPAEAQEGSLSGGAATFAAGKFDSTVRLMTGVLQGDNVPPADAAKALYFRGLAYQKLGQHTRAIADLGAAMWLGLSSSERTVALVNRSLAYQAAGLKTQAEAELASARKTGSSGEVEKLLASNGGSGTRRRFHLTLRHGSPYRERADQHGCLCLSGCSAAPSAGAAQRSGGKSKLLDHHARRSAGKPSSFERQSYLPLVGIGEGLIERT